MGFNRYNIGFFTRVIILTLLISLFLFCLFIHKEYIQSVYVFVAICFSIWNLYHYISRISRDFYTFISALANEEYSIQFSAKENNNLKYIYSLYNTTAKRFQKVKYDRDLQHIFLEEILNQIEVGIIAFDKSGKILLQNRAFRSIFSIRKPQNISELDSFIKESIDEIKPGNRLVIYPIVNDTKLTLSAHSTNFKLKDQQLTLIYFHNIKQELDEQELESWQKLYSVLTHEIMNSVTPISSLSSSLNDKLKNDLTQIGTAESRTLSLLTEGLEAMAIRTKGLLSFTDSFRKLSKVPQPKPIEFELSKLLERVNSLFQPTFNSNGIKFSYTISPEAKLITADPSQLDQVFINLIQNATDALSNKQNGEIKVTASKYHDGKTEITIKDNGIGISHEALEKVFVPFFTTKEKGSGIGLSLSRQIIKKHGGSIELKSTQEEGTTVTIKL